MPSIVLRFLNSGLQTGLECWVSSNNSGSPNLELSRFLGKL